jgi:hypothetical protein
MIILLPKDNMQQAVLEAFMYISDLTCFPLTGEKPRREKNCKYLELKLLRFRRHMDSSYFLMWTMFFSHCETPAVRLT